MKRGRIERSSDRFREIPTSVAFIETTAPTVATSLLSHSTTSIGSGTIPVSNTTAGDEDASREEGHRATDRILWHESWVKKIEARRSGVAVTKLPVLSKLPVSKRDATTPASPSNWRAIGCASLVIAIVAFWHRKVIDPRYQTFMPAEWHWDHNIYMPIAGGGTGSRDTPASLIAQVVPGTALSQLGDISMRPNRAYARQWAIDFARYDSGRTSYDRRACFEKVAVLNEVLDRQSNDTDGKYSWQRDSNIEYEYILLLPADAILVELDTNILGTILPPGQDKMVAIAGWTERDGLVSNSDIILFNLKHRHTEAVARLWLEMVTSMDMTCGDNNDLGMLVTAVAMVLDGTEELSNLIQPLEETEDGFVGDRLIKTISIAVPESRTAFLHDFLQQSAVSLQATADAVCFRFFPKCEVLSGYLIPATP